MSSHPRRLEAPGLLSGLLFFAVVLVGCAYIVVSKLHSFGATYVTLVPVCIMTFRDVVCPSVQSALRDCLRWTRGRRHYAGIVGDVGSYGSIRSFFTSRLPE